MFINIGFVYEEIAAIQSDLQKIMKSFQHKNLLVTAWKVARDEDGDE